MDEDNLDWSSDDDFASTSTSICLSSTKYFTRMGFPENLVLKALKEFDGRGSEDDIIDTILTYEVLEEPSRNTEPILVNPENLEMNSTDSEVEFSDEEPSPSTEPILVSPENSDVDFSDDEDNINEECVGSSKVVTILSLLINMGYKDEEVLTAIEKSGKDTPVEELIECIHAAQLGDAQGNTSLTRMQEAAGPSSGNDSLMADLHEMGYKPDEVSAAVDIIGSDGHIVDFIEFIDAFRLRDTFEPEAQYVNLMGAAMKRKVCSFPSSNKKRKNVCKDETTHFPNPKMTGFGIPSMPYTGCHRMRVPKIAWGKPYFYYENVACAPVGVWNTIQNSLYMIEPEYVDSRHFSAANRKRGYIHNLPIENRFPLTPLPPATIHEAFPDTKEWWPRWDPRTKLNCLVTCIGSAQLTDRIQNAIEHHSQGDNEPPAWVKKWVIKECKTWNLVWIGENKAAHLEPHQMEELLGFPNNHTRGFSTTDRHKFLGNSFQIDTVAYHLSVLKELYPGGINVLSLFSGIGGAEVALHRLGISMKNVVSIEISEKCRKILRGWWKQTKQKGSLIHEVHDVTEVTNEMLMNWISKIGFFDLVIGGSPCNNLAGGNRVSRVGLQGEHSSLFYQYVRILKEVRSIQNGT